MHAPVPTPRSNYADKLRAFPDTVFADDRAFLHRGQWAAYFRNRIGPSFSGKIIFEIGCFDAAYLCRIAAQHPTTGFIGLDWKCKAIHDGATRIAKENRPNITLLRGRGQDLTRMCGDNELDELWLFHPDPCDKPAELPNRLMAEPFLIDAHRVLRDDTSRLVLKTDHPGYYQWTLALFGLRQPWWFVTDDRTNAPRTRFRDLTATDVLPAASGTAQRLFDIAANSADLWNDPGTLSQVESRLFRHETTLFENRFVAKRHPIYYMEFQRRPTSSNV